MPQNYLIIGLGGTGGKIIRSFKKIVSQDFGESIPEPVKIRYLYVDSNSKDLEASSSWLTQGEVGEDISLSKASQFAISHNNLADRLSDPVHNPVTHRYIGNPKHWADIFSSMNVSEAAGGQIRRLGESLFEPRTRDFMAQVRLLVGELMRESRQNGTHFHICAGLAGGTGSGIFLQVIAQLRKAFPDSRLFPISLYLLLPEENSPWASNNQSTNYYANGFAALTELNAYMLTDEREGSNRGGPIFRMVDLTGDQERLEGLRDRVQSVFIVSDINEEDHSISIANEMPELIAQLLHQRMFVIDSADALRFGSLQRAVSMENAMVADEGQKTNAQVKLRSVRFSSFGVKRVLVPEEDIRNHFASTLATEALRQMLYNNWQAVEQGTGSPYFKREKRNLSLRDYVSQPDVRRRWKLSDEQVTLSEGILDVEIEAQRRGWRPHYEHWSELSKRFLEQATALAPVGGKDERLKRLEEAFTLHAEQQYRGVGRDRFFDMKTEDLGQPERHVSEIRQTFEDWMMDQWLSGEYGIADLETLVDDLLADLKTRIAAIAPELERLQSAENELLASIQKNRTAWEKIGLGGRALGWTGIFTTYDEVLAVQNGHLVALHRGRTEKRGWTFASSLLSKVRAELESKVKPLLSQARTALNDLDQFFENRRVDTCRDDQPKKKSEDGGSGAKAHADNVVKLYQPAETRKFAISLLEEERNQRAWAAESRAKLIELANQQCIETRGRERGFAKLVIHGLRTPEAKATQDKVSRSQAEQEHQNRTGTIGRHIGVNIVEKLAEYFPQQAKLKSYVEQLVATAQTFNRYRTIEYSGGSGPASMMAVILPTAEGQTVFRDKLADLFRESQGPGVTVYIVDSNRRPNEITLLSFKSWFPLRFLEQVYILRGYYQTRLKQGDPTRATMEIFTEDHRPALPSLYRPTGDELWKSMLPTLQLAQAAGLLTTGTNYQTNRVEHYLERRDAQGLPHQHHYPTEVVSLLTPPAPATPVKVAETSGVLRALQMLTEEQQEVLDQAVNELLQQDQYRLATTREELKETLRAQVDSARAWRGGNMQDDIFLRVRASTADAIAKLDYAN